jgi:hypothetical protein
MTGTDSVKAEGLNIAVMVCDYVAGYGVRSIIAAR